MWNKIRRFQGIIAVGAGYLAGALVVVDHGSYSALFWASIVLMAFAGITVPDARTTEHS